MAIHHSVTSAVTSALSNPAVSTAAAVPHVHVPVATAAVLSHGATGATGAVAGSSTPIATWHTVAKLAEAVGIPVAAYLIRKSEPYQEAKDALSDLLAEVLGILSDRLEAGEPASLSSIPQPSA